MAKLKVRINVPDGMAKAYLRKNKSWRKLDGMTVYPILGSKVRVWQGRQEHAWCPEHSKTSLDPFYVIFAVRGALKEVWLCKTCEESDKRQGKLKFS